MLGKPHRILALSLALLACACSLPRRPLEPRPRAAIISVSNHHWSIMNVHLVASGVAIRLGTVTSYGTERFAVPPTLGLPLEVQIRATPVGGGPAYLTQSITAFPGDRLVLRLENHLPLSSLIRQ